MARATSRSRTSTSWSWPRPRWGWRSRTSCCAGRSRRESRLLAAAERLRRVARGDLVGAGGRVLRLDRDELLPGLEAAASHLYVRLLKDGEALDGRQLAGPLRGARLQGRQARSQPGEGLVGGDVRARPDRRVEVQAGGVRDVHLVLAGVPALHFLRLFGGGHLDPELQGRRGGNLLEVARHGELAVGPLRVVDDVELAPVEAEDVGGLPLVAPQLVAADPELDLAGLGLILEPFDAAADGQQGVGGGRRREQEQEERKQKASRHTAFPFGRTVRLP